MKIINLAKKIAILSLAAMLGAAVLGPQLHTYAVPMEPIRIVYEYDASILRWGFTLAPNIRFYILTADIGFMLPWSIIREMVLENTSRMSRDAVRSAVPTEEGGMCEDHCASGLAVIIGWFAPEDENLDEGSLGHVDEFTVWPVLLPNRCSADPAKRLMRCVTKIDSDQDVTDTGPIMTLGRFGTVDHYALFAAAPARVPVEAVDGPMERLLDPTRASSSLASAPVVTDRTRRSALPDFAAAGVRRAVEDQYNLAPGGGTMSCRADDGWQHSRARCGADYRLAVPDVRGRGGIVPWPAPRRGRRGRR